MSPDPNYPQGGATTAPWDTEEARTKRRERGQRTGIAATVATKKLAIFNKVDQNEVELYDVSGDKGYIMAIKNGLFKDAETYTITEYDPHRSEKRLRISTVLAEELELNGMIYKPGFVINQEYSK